MVDSQELRLSERQELILASVVEEYVSTGTPVGSKTLVELAGLDVSASTVRNELAVLEEQGLLMHPHTSAGRVPTEVGYRFFVDRVLDRPGPRASLLELDLTVVESEVDPALRATTEALAELTHLLALVSAPSPETTIVRHVEVLLLQAAGRHGRRHHVDGRGHEARVHLRRGRRSWSRRVGGPVPERDRRGAAARGPVAPHPLRRPGAVAARARVPRALRPAFTDVMEADEQTLYVGGTAGVLDEFRADELRRTGACSRCSSSGRPRST